jgi:orotidine-5'-phosphate decarboxylase
MNTTKQADHRIFVALDVPTLSEALALVEQVQAHVAGFKVGLELCSAVGVPRVVETIGAIGGTLFLDLKFHDIPNTVSRAVHAISTSAAGRVRMLTLHCNGGSAMMHAAAAAVQAIPQRPLLLGVTVLTSMDQHVLDSELGVERLLEKQALHLALLAQKSGLDGVIASPRECAIIKQACGADFLVVTPGVRPAWASHGDQRRSTTPAEAVRAGADYLVIGRPITAAPAAMGGPSGAVARIAEELQEEAP